MPLPVLSDVPEALRFLTRLPVPESGTAPAGSDGPARPYMDRLAPAFPVAGAIIGLLGALVLAIGLAVHLGSWVSSVLAVAVMTAITGALHEDGLADTADGLGGNGIERRLEIMKDSRIGSFGVLALVLAMLLKVGALEGLSFASGLDAGAALVAAGALSRTAGPWMLAVLPPARASGLAAGVGRPSAAACRMAAAIGVVIAFAATVPVFGLAAFVVALIFGIAAFFGIVRLARAQFGGQTGDIAGAAIVAVEIAFLTGLLIFARQL
ncbi:adenosylcobinamide-GDP ribazoletransferase [Ancylobacter mangrovi]|uniref:adenosylcobinamide-GDP ribazoletransferase n=1 Tax=Ancylobacter mangrovi TaxID=2972472 RepID=UPI002162536F|nr:adenosylcobinamide-GDP ribazoletransferase [Ancylobacter mangrovi]MCS0501292.1 adenosylcobinamide-GDP ribazoletransferase [Ancylobacter mangrovi]